MSIFGPKLTPEIIEYFDDLEALVEVMGKRLGRVLPFISQPRSMGGGIIPNGAVKGMLREYGVQTCATCALNEARSA